MISFLPSLAVPVLAAAADPVLTLASGAGGGGGELDTEGLADWLRGFFGPLFLVIVSVVAIFFLFTREITRFVQFVLLAIFIGIVFYVPQIIEVTATAIARAVGVTAS